MFNISVPTLGGRRYWTDLRIQDGWRVQRRAGSKTCRLLDRFDIQRCRGDEEAMLLVMEDRIAQGAIGPLRSDVVVLIHGLGRSNHSLRSLAKAFRAKGFEVIDFNYASSQFEISVHSHNLNRVLTNLKGAKRVSFVTHSLGGIVLRHALTQSEPWQKNIQLHRAVLLTAPNQGSAVARMLTGRPFMDDLFGPALRQLANPKLGQNNLLNMTFTTIAGTVNWLPFLSGVNDGLVTEEETRLDGSDQHKILKASHAFVMNDKDVISFATEYLTNANEEK